MRRTPRLALALTALVASLLTAAPTAGITSAAAAPTPSCATWTKSQVAGGLGVLENLSFDGTGGLLLSSQSLIGPGKVLRLGSNGTRTTVAAGIDGPGGQVVDGRTLYLNTGNSVVAGLLGQRTGTLSALDLDTGTLRPIATGLLMPNGLIRLPDGSFLVSRDLGARSNVVRIRPDGTVEDFAPSVTSTNGMAYDARSGVVYIASTFNPTSTISVVDLDDPDAAPRVITLPGIGPLNAADDLTLGTDGFVYVALNVIGKVVRVDPDSGTACTIASGVPFASSLRFGAGPGWDERSLYVTSFLGTVTRLAP